jgi:potassium efflux system protein
VPQRRALVLGISAVGLVVLGLLWGVLEPRTAPAWLVEISERLTGGHAREITAAPIRIAVAVDGPDEEGPGRSVVRGVQLFLDEINARGGIHGAPLEIETYGDGGEIEAARRIARDIAASEAVAVIGHRLTVTSMAAGPVYQVAQIPVITPTATHPDLTHDNPWFFRTIYDDDHLGQFIAHYTAAVIEPDQTVVVLGSHAYGLNLAQVFVETAKAIDLPLAAEVTLDDEDPPAERQQQIDDILDLLSARAGRSVVFLAMYPEEAVELIRAVRDAGLDRVALVAPDAFDRPDFPSLFDAFPNARRSPGFYSDGIDVATPLIYDTAGREAGLFLQAYRDRFDRFPDWRAAYAYDAARAIAEALRRSGNAGEDPAAVRAAVRDQLAAMDGADTGFQGIPPVYSSMRHRLVLDEGVQGG